ncbi:hypothetical protein O6H91_04G124900 [Diphasiastrum complanatum]|uniref:Uncharacterized protein n=1 Tax=Diphasiastrum complanatum TaxID=34168 RepID=A0ACC2E1H0_DIPCM|nr:hypothetical protein O6H91_Y512800 [Diphasiastrum complanatum]KAJ7560334.1 hypothetical protein O6H91_04G124900 [Diphasiastrum complanatum]
MASKTMVSSNNGAIVASRSPLTRQGSIYTLTLDELQNSLIDSGKNFGSMSMDEFLKNIWTAEESQAMASAITNVEGGSGAPIVAPPATNLQRPGSLTLPRTLSHKTVDEVWKEIQGQKKQQEREQQQQRRQGTFGEMTLEDFLVKAGVVREDADVIANPSRVAPFGTSYGVGVSSTRPGIETLPQNQQQQQAEWVNYQLKQQQQQLLLQQQAAAAMASVTKRTGSAGGMLLQVPPLSNMVEGPLDIGPGLAPGSLVGAMALSPGLLTPDTPNRKRGFDNAIEKTVERRQRRMIKNRESAARSRARKQAYTVELEAEVTQLKEENSRLKTQQAEEKEKRWRQLMETRIPVNELKKPMRVLRRTLSSEW